MSKGYVRSKLDKIKGVMQETAFLVSDSYKGFLQKSVSGITGRYDLRVIFTNGVFTDNKVISVNPVHPSVMQLPSLAEKTLHIIGQLAHEIFHILYTDFETLVKLGDLHKTEGPFRFKIAHTCMNIIEDSAIELAGTNYYTGTFRQGIIAINKEALNRMPSLNELASKGAPRLAIMEQACAMYCILGTMKGTLVDPELLDMFNKAMPILDEGRLSKDSWGRLDAAEKLYALIEPLVEEAELMRKQQQEEDNFNYPKNKKISSGGQGDAIEAPGFEQDFQQNNRTKTKKEMEAAKEEASSQKGTSTSGEDAEDSADDTSGAGKAESGESDGADDETEKDAETSSSSNEKNDEENETNEKGGSGKGNESQDDDAKEPEKTEEELQSEKELEESLKNLEDQLGEVKENAAQEEYDKEEQKKQDKAIRDFAKTVSYSDMHANIKVDVKRVFDVDSLVCEHYNGLFAKISGMTRNLTKRLLDIIKYNQDQKLTGMFEGKVNKNQLSRLDKRVFFQRKDKSDEASLAIAVLVDMSGSMNGGRIEYAQKACIVLKEVCDALQIPIAIIGHTAKQQRDQVEHHHFCDFDSKDKKEKYKLIHMRAYENTREGVSLKYAGEYLLRRPEEDKILISISDGDPFHFGLTSQYHGEDARKDTGRVAKELEGKGLKIFGCAIGDGKSAIKDIYTHNFMDIPDLTLLPTRLIGLIQKNVLK